MNLISNELYNYAINWRDKYDDVMSELLVNFDRMDDIHSINVKYGGYYQPVKPEDRIKKYFAYVKRIKIINKRMNNQSYLILMGKIVKIMIQMLNVLSGME